MYAFGAIYDSQARLGSASNALWLWHPGVAIALLTSGALGKAIAEGYPRPNEGGGFRSLVTPCPPESGVFPLPRSPSSPRGCGTWFLGCP
jgi:hypothetical protein